MKASCITKAPNPRLGLRLEDDGTATLVDYGDDGSTEQLTHFDNPQSALGAFHKMVGELDDPLYGIELPDDFGEEP
jgi:hypothetical protein